MKPKTPQEYLENTEHAVRHFYAGLDSCWAVYRQALSHWDLSKAGELLTPENKAKLDEYLKLAHQYFDLKFSEATFAGSILQVAAMGIQYFSRNTVIPASCRDIVPKNHRATRFCVGKELYGLPIGLIVYAARNQYAHWDKEDLHEINRKIFQGLSLAHYADPLRDLAYDLSNPTITIYANEVLLGALKWTTYETYVAEVTALLDEACSSK